MHSVMWRDIGIHLGFQPSELTEIQDRLSSAPASCLSAMLAKWLMRAPGDSRGTVSLEDLKQALIKAGLKRIAHELRVVRY